MKLPWKREPRDLVGEQVQEVYKRPLTPEEADRLKWAGMVLVPDEMSFPVTAAGGWCAPSSPVYDLFEMAARNRGTGPASAIPLMVSVPPPPFEDGLLSLPELSVRRGGVSFPPPGRRPAAPTPWPAPEPIFKDATAP